MSTRDPSRYEPPGRRSGARDGGPATGGPRTRPRARVRALLPLAVAAWAVLEVWLLLLVGDAAGGLTVFLLLAATFVLGAAVIKRAGRRALRTLTEALQPPGTAPGPAAARPSRTPSGGHAPAVLGGLLLMLPGLLSDAAGLLCLFPPTAALLRRGTDRWLARRASAAGTGSLGEALRQARTAGDQARMRRPDGKVVQGEVVRDDDGEGDRDDGGPGGPPRPAP
ncbi:FxsA family membrane protein [Streptomyces sp. TRM70308]|uniref:FxsA family membrane protein n=1 Tax=Streptomyces sp. TRM70308 TaxID=3131932 RepID=UPI003D094A4D